MKLCNVFFVLSSARRDEKLSKHNTESLSLSLLRQIHDFRLEADATTTDCATESGSTADGVAEAAANTAIDDAQSTIATTSAHVAIDGHSKCVKQKALLVLQSRVGLRRSHDH